MLLDLMRKCIDEKCNMIITDGYNNLYRLEYADEDCFMYEHSATTHLTIPVEVSFDILSNEFYIELYEREF